MDNDAYLIQAIANIKQVHIGSVIRSLEGLTPDAVRRLMANKNIQEEMNKLRSEDESSSEVSLDDLMDDVKWK